MFALTKQPALRRLMLSKLNVLLLCIFLWAECLYLPYVRVYDRSIWREGFTCIWKLNSHDPDILDLSQVSKFKGLTYCICQDEFLFWLRITRNISLYKTVFISALSKVRVWTKSCLGTMKFDFYPRALFEVRKCKLVTIRKSLYWRSLSNLRKLLKLNVSLTAYSLRFIQSFLTNAL